jgi:radical SAM protein with 4Fe4S-binding SPASM domain
MSLETDMVRVLRERKLLITSLAEDDIELAIAIKNLHKKLDQPKILYLMLAQGCNFSCRYCPIPSQASRYGENLMSSEAARSGIILWAEHLNDAGGQVDNTIIFYGGEPLLNKTTLMSAISDIDEMKKSGRLPKETGITLVTNSVLIDETVIDRCREHNIVVMVGIDGHKVSANSLRLYPDGSETFSDTVNVIRRLVSSGIKVFVSASMTPSNLDEIQELTIFLKKLGVEKFGLNFLKGRGLADLMPEPERCDFEYGCAKALIRNYNENKDDEYEYQVARKVMAFKNHDYFPVDCTCYGNQLVVQADGQISNCPFFRANLGQVGRVGRNFRINKTQIVVEWRKRLPIVNASYRECDAKALCGPGCAWSVLELTGDVVAPDTMTKTFSEEVFNELIWSKYEK